MTYATDKKAFHTLEIANPGDEPQPNLKRMSSECEANVKSERIQSDIVTKNMI
jgi:hypothetical protein